jgi:hypothetical protein
MKVQAFIVCSRFLQAADSFAPAEAGCSVKVASRGANLTPDSVGGSDASTRVGSADGPGAASVEGPPATSTFSGRSS